MMILDIAYVAAQTVTRTQYVVWPTFAAAFIGAIGTVSGSIYAVKAKRAIYKAERKQEKRQEEERLATAGISAQVDLTKNVLENWKEIVQQLGLQIKELHDQVIALEDRERRCQVELFELKKRLYSIEQTNQEINRHRNGGEPDAER